MVVGIFALIMSTICFWMSIKLIKTHFKVKRWEKVEATILSKEVKLHQKVSTSKSPYGIFVEYSYLYKNTEYKNNKVFITELLGGQSNYQKQAADKIASNLIDKTFIYVNQNIPKESVIYYEGLGLYILVFFMGILGLLIALYNIV